jgi:putative hydrolase of the HAD superfamily
MEMREYKIKNIYFDWGGTLAYSKKRDEFINNKSEREKLSILYSDAVYILKYLKDKGYTLGIISNTRRDCNKFMEALKIARIMEYFEGAIILSGEHVRYKKPSKEIFNDALTIDGISGENAVMIGNDYYKDIVGGSQMNMYTVYVERIVEHDKTEEKKIYNWKIKELIELENYF